MDNLILIACPACTFSNPTFLLLSMWLGTVSVVYVLLRPHTRGIPLWGMPRISVARVGSLLLMAAWLVPLWFLGQREHSVERVALCVGGLFFCCFYLWLRSCWLLDTHHVRSAGRELLFPGLLSPGLLVLGTTAGRWVLGMLLVVPVWPFVAVPHTIWSMVIAVPIGALVHAGLKYTFSEQDAVETRGTDRTSISQVGLGNV